MARDRDTWYRLDNVGKFYASQAGRPAQTVFRYAATLVDDVDPTVLQRALDRTIERYPGFNVCLRSGMFWHYLQQATTRPLVEPEDLPICFALHVDAKSVLFRVSYYRTRVNLEVSHIVSDGRGSLGFFRALLSMYLQERYGVEGVEVEYDGSLSQKAENSFDKYFEREKAATTRVPRAYHLRGWRDKADLTFMEYHLPLAPVLGLARSWGVSLTSLAIAVYMAAIRDEMARRDRSRAICMDVPVDLRQIFESSTAKNFFGLAYVSYVPGEADEPVEDIARQVNAQLRAAVRPEAIKRRMNRMIALEKNPVLRFAPLFVKDFVLGIADWFAANGTTTTSVSNLGPIALDPRLAPHVRDVNVLTSAIGMKLTMCSFGDDLSLAFVSAYANLAVVRNVCRFFAGRGIEGRMNVNKTHEEVAEGQPQVALETSVRRLEDQMYDRAAQARAVPVGAGERPPEEGADPADPAGPAEGAVFARSAAGAVPPCGEEAAR